MKRKTIKPDLPPVKTKPDNSEMCICFGHGAWYNYKMDPISIGTCDTCEGVGYLAYTHALNERCPDRFPNFCSLCECKCLDCQRTRVSIPKWEEFETRHATHPGNGYPGKFITWGTDPFMHLGGGIYRIGIFQPWPTAGFVWHVCEVETTGRVMIISSPYYRSAGAFYSRRPEECNEHESGSALKDATASAQEKMRQLLK